MPLEVLPNTFVGYEAASHSTFDGLSEVVHKSEVTANECCFCLNDNDDKLWVMLSVADAASIDYWKQDPKTKKVFDAARKSEVQNLSLIHI